MDNETYSSENFQRVWTNLSPKVQAAIKTKAQWEYMSVSAVMREWWPALWKQVRCPRFHNLKVSP